jgi:hypothetical protein
MFLYPNAVQITPWGDGWSNAAGLGASGGCGCAPDASCGFSGGLRRLFRGDANAVILDLEGACPARRTVMAFQEAEQRGFVAMESCSIIPIVYRAKRIIQAAKRIRTGRSGGALALSIAAEDGGGGDHFGVEERVGGEAAQEVAAVAARSIEE